MDDFYPTVRIILKSSISALTLYKNQMVQDEMEQSSAARPPVVSFVHFDLDPEQSNTVAKQAKKYEEAFCTLGWQICDFLSGAGDVWHLIPGMHWQDPTPDAPLLEFGEVMSALERVDLVWVTNLSAPPKSQTTADQIVQAVTELNKPTIFSYNALESDGSIEYDIPVNIDQKHPWHTVTTSSFVAESLTEQGLLTHVLEFETDVDVVEKIRHLLQDECDLGLLVKQGEAAALPPPSPITKAPPVPRINPISPTCVRNLSHKRYRYLHDRSNSERCRSMSDSEYGSTTFTSPFITCLPSPLSPIAMLG